MILISVFFLPQLGKNLRRCIQRARQENLDHFPNEKILLILRQLADAINYLQRIGIQHNDIKPSNVLYNK